MGNSEMTDAEKIAGLEDRTRFLSEVTYRIIDILGTIVEFRNLETVTHVKRIRAITHILGSCYMRVEKNSGLTPEMVDEIAKAAVLHDVGKIAIPDSILLKPGKLTRDEFDLMKTHTTKGAEIVDRILDGREPDTYMTYCRDIAKYHHEKYDGRGYPEGLKGDRIPLAAQFVSLADCYDALISERVYKAAYSKEEAFDMIKGGECGIFNPRLMNCFIISKAEIEKICDEIEETADKEYAVSAD
ncbi:MAG: HD domain-containing protein [Lachnospiraceae bacterium]|nr:HD domain-containing protein [Lachnospiraceae bacterium]